MQLWQFNVNKIALSFILFGTPIKGCPAKNGTRISDINQLMDIYLIDCSKKCQITKKVYTCPNKIMILSSNDTLGNNYSSLAWGGGGGGGNRLLNCLVAKQAVVFPCTGSR